MGAADDRAELEADQVADAVVRSLRSPGAMPSIVGAEGDDRRTRIRRAARPEADVVRRSAYLANADDLIYKDSEDDSIELMFVTKAWDVNVFVEYGRALDVRTWAARAFNITSGTTTNGTRSTRRTRGGGGGKMTTKTTKASADDPYALTYSEVDRRAPPRGPVLKGLAAETMEQEISPGRDEYDTATAKLGRVYTYDGTKLADLQLSDKQRGFVARTLIALGAKSLPTGHGSRLPSPKGTVYTRGAKTSAEVLDALGVEAKSRAAYAGLEITALADDAYLERRDAASKNGENVFDYANAGMDLWFFYVSTVPATRSSNSRIQVAGTSYPSDDEFFGNDPTTPSGQQTARTLASGFARLTAPTASPDWVSGRRLAAAMDREDGQAAAMDSWNALGAAAYANKYLGRAYDLKQNWEWLHLQGAQIGGVTAGGNLVPGVFATNSAMIPFENMIKNWAIQDATHFEAKFVATGIDGVFVNRIELWIKADGHATLGTLPGQLLASFDPLTGRVVDKMAGEIVKRQIDQRVGVL